MKNPQDRFDRKMARQLAIGRMVETPHVVSMHHNVGELTLLDVTTYVMEDILDRQSEFPSRAVKAARLWIRSLEEHVTETVIH